MQATRTPLSVMLSVWKALFLRESLARFFSARGAWFWLVASPVFHTGYLLFIFTVISVHTIGGIDTMLWLVVGLQAFFMFQRTATQVGQAVNANRALFAYRQVKPIDTALVRAGMEGFLNIIITTFLLAGLALLGRSAMPIDPLTVLEAFLGMWILGVGFGLISSVAIHLIPELDRVINLIMMPMYMISGVMFPVAAVPQPYRDWLLLNPVAHGVEATRLGFAPYYHVVPEMSLSYIHWLAVIMLFFGMALHRRFSQRMLSQ